MSEYAAAPSSGRLKLKGVTDGRVDKKKRSKKPSASEENTTTADILVKLQDSKETHRGPDERDHKQARDQTLEADVKDPTIAPGTTDDDIRDHLKTEAERRHEEQRRKRLEERLKKEGVKSHKQRVEELNRYLSNLSEHHDMPKIGPG